MNMRTGANELSNQSLTSASADRTDNQQDDQRDDSVETASKKSDSGIYMDANGETQAWETHHMDRDDHHQPNAIVQTDSSQDVEASYLEDSASVLSNGTTISSLIDEEEEGKQVYNIETTNPSRLFWVPAEQHPEIAPAEFANWLQTHGVIRAKGQLRVRRKRSILSISYLPPEDNEDRPDSQPRRRSYDSAPTRAPSISQPLHTNLGGAIAEEEEDTLTTTPANDLLRRSVSLNVHAPTGRQPSNSSQSHVFDRHSTARDESPVLVPRAEGSLLRRSNRTKLRRSSLQTSNRGSSTDVGRRASGRLQSAHGKPTDYPDRFGVVPPGGITLQDRPVSISELVDFGGADYEPAESQQGIITRVHDAENEVFSRIAAEESQQEVPVESEIPTAQTHQEGDILPIDTPTKSDTIELPHTSTNVNNAAEEPQVIQVSSPDNGLYQKEVALVSVRPKHNRSKSDRSPLMGGKPEKRSSWAFKFLSDDKTKKKTAEQRPHQPERPPSVASTETQSTALVKPKTQANDLLANSAKIFSLSSLFQRTSIKLPKAAPNGNFTMTKKAPKDNDAKAIVGDWSRFPIHIERAVYRLSHFKLSNPRRPLHHQVLISNMMFWYLSIINGQQVRPQQQQQQQQRQQKQQKQQKQQQQNQASENETAVSPSPQSFVVRSQNTYQEDQEAAPAKLGKVSKFINASKKRRQEIMVKKQMQQQIHHQPRWLPTIAESVSAPSDGSGPVSTTPPPPPPPPPPLNDGHPDRDEAVPSSKNEKISFNQPSTNASTNKPSNTDKYSPIPNEQYQPSVGSSPTTNKTSFTSTKTATPHPLPPIPGPPLLNELSRFDSFSDDILSSLGFEENISQSSEDDNVPLGLYRKQA